MNLVTSRTVNSFQYVDTQADLDALVARLQDVETIALDTEADSLHHYFEKVCLIQMSFEGEEIILDPLAKLNLDPFFQTLTTRNLIFHGAEYDLRMLRASHQFHPKGELFDTMLAAQLIEGEARSLVALADRYLDVQLTKQGQRSDWSKRPLSGRQLEYAANDTRYLEQIASHQRKELAVLNRTVWHSQACLRMIEATRQDRPDSEPEREWRIKGLTGMERRQLAFVRAIWYWRDDQARRADLPPFKILGNPALIELALWAAGRNGRSFDTAPKLPRNLVGRRFNALRREIEKVWRFSPDEYPEYLKSGGYAPPEFGPELEKLKAECDRLGEKLGLTSSLVASRRQLEAITLGRPTNRARLQEVGNLMTWQADLLAEFVVDLFSK